MSITKITFVHYLFKIWILKNKYSIPDFKILHILLVLIWLLLVKVRILSRICKYRQISQSKQFLRVNPILLIVILIQSILILDILIRLILLSFGLNRGRILAVCNILFLIWGVLVDVSNFSLKIYYYFAMFIVNGTTVRTELCWKIDR